MYLSHLLWSFRNIDTFNDCLGLFSIALTYSNCGPLSLMAEGVETTPLLGNPDLSSSSPIIPSPTRKDIFRPGKLHAHFSKWAILYLCGLVVFLADFGTFMGEGARLRMLELGVCREYYISTDPRVIRNDGSIPEELCKLDQIQSELARMRGFLGLLENLPGMTINRSPYIF